MDLVVMSLERWDGIWRRNQHLVAGLLRARADLRVLFVEPPADPLHQVARRQVPRWGDGLREVDLRKHEGRDRLTAYQPTKLLPRRLDRQLDARLAARVARTARRTGMRDPVLWVNDPGGAEVLELTGWRALYDITDDWLLAPRTAAQRQRLRAQETVLLRDCAEVVVCSPELARTRGRHRRVRLIPNAVDVAAYQRQWPRPPDLPPGPTVLYVGTLHRDRLDVELCVQTATHLGDKGRLVLVGPVALPAEDRQRLSRAGVLLLGAREADQVPGYLQHADVLVVPHLVNAFTQSLDPIKAYEYRAAGRPVVATRVPGFDGATSAQVTVVEAALLPGAVAARLADRAPSVPATDVPDWSERVTAMGEVLDAVRAAR